MSKSLVSAFHIKPNNNLVLNDYDIFQDKELLIISQSCITTIEGTTIIL